MKNRYPFMVVAICVTYILIGGAARDSIDTAQLFRATYPIPEDTYFPDLFRGPVGPPREWPVLVDSERLVVSSVDLRPRFSLTAMTLPNIEEPISRETHDLSLRVFAEVCSRDRGDRSFYIDAFPITSPWSVEDANGEIELQKGGLVGSVKALPSEGRNATVVHDQWLEIDLGSMMAAYQEGKVHGLTLEARENFLQHSACILHSSEAEHAPRIVLKRKGVETAYLPVVGYSEPRGWLSDGELVGDVLFAVDRFRGFIVLDVVDPARVIEMARLPLSKDLEFLINDPLLVIDGDVAFVALGNHIYAIDIDDLHSPTLLGVSEGISFADPSVLSLEIHGQHLVVGTYTDGLVLVDISEPASMMVASRLYLQLPEGILSENGNLYVGHLKGLSRIGIGPDGSMVEWHRSSDVGSLMALARIGDQLHAVSNWGTLVRYELDASAGPVFKASTRVIRGGETMEAVGGRLYVGVHPEENRDASSPFDELSIFDPHSHALVGGVAIRGNVLSLAASQHRVVVFSGSAATILDVSRPGDPRVIGEIDAPP